MRSIAWAASASRFAAFAIGGFERPRPVDRGVEFDREPRAVVLHQREFFLLGCARFVVAHAPVGRQLERVDRRGEPFQRHLDRFQGGLIPSIVTACLRDG